MSQQVITTLLSDKSAEIYDPAVPTMIDVSHVTMDFNSASQQLIPSRSTSLPPQSAS